MATFLSILFFIALGAGAGLLVTRRYKESSLLANILAGIAGSLTISWLASLLGLGAGFAALSVWGVLFGAAGGCLIPLLICKIQQKATSTS